MAAPPPGYWHAIPLHYVACLLRTGRLLSQARLRELGVPVRPRPSAMRRDRKLGLDGYVHLSFASHTPLLADKLRQGYSHALIEFAPDTADLPGAAFERYNAKAWTHRDDFRSIADAAGKAAFLEEWAAGRYPSAELLVPGELPLVPFARALHLTTSAEAEWLDAIRAALDLPDVPARAVTPSAFGEGAWPTPDLAPFTEYLEACRGAGRLLPPPDLPFD